MSTELSIVSVNVSENKGTPKQAVPRITLTDRGVEGDAHSGPWHRQVSILSQELIDEFQASTGRATSPGEFAENLTIKGLDLSRVAPLDRLHIGSDVVLEITQVGKACHGDSCAIYREVGTCVMPKEGLFARVLAGGTVEPGDGLVYAARPVQIRVITLSDRAAAGHYADRSGPAICEALQSHFEPRRWTIEVERTVMPDDPEQLRDALLAARAAATDVVITTGSTGVGPRDIAPEVTTPLCDKIIPGVMEYVRLKYGANKPGALLSRGVAGVMGSTLVFNLPGSTRAVSEYMSEILKNLEHLLYTIHGIDVHQQAP